MYTSCCRARFAESIGTVSSSIVGPFCFCRRAALEAVWDYNFGLCVRKVYIVYLDSGWSCIEREIAMYK